MATMVAVFALNASAWDGSEGKVYLQNVSSGLWWGAGNSWGTQASLLKHPEYVILHKMDDGTYQMETQVSNGGTAYYFEGAFMDNGSPVNLTFEKLRETYNISNGSVYYGYDGSSTVLAQRALGAEGLEWKVFTEEEMIANLANATESNPVDATFYILDPNFGRNNRNTVKYGDNNWGGAWTMVASNQTLHGGDNTNMCAESWKSSFTLSQTISVENGKYRLYAQAALTDYAEKYDGANYPVVYINDKYLPFNNMEEGDRGTSMGQLSGSFTAGKYGVGPIDVNVTDGSITVGVKGTRTDTWCIWDNFELYYLGPITDLGPFIEAYLNALNTAKATAASTDKIAPSILSALNSTIAANDEGKVSKTSKDALVAATNALKEANDKALVSQASYKIIAGGTLPNDKLSGWTCTNTNDFVINTWSKEGNNDGSGMTTPFIQNWVARASTLGDGMVYYTLEGLEPGEVYYAQALIRAYSESGNEPNGPVFFVNDSEKSIPENGTAFEYSGMKGFYGTFGDVASVGSDGKLIIGVKLSETNFNWVAFKNVAIQSMDDALQAAIDKVEANYGKVPAAAESNAKAFVTTTKSGLKTASDYVNAIQALNQKADELAAIALSYAKYLKLQSYGNDLAAVPSDNASGKSTLNSKKNATDNTVNNATTQGEIDGAYDTLKQAMVTYANASNPTKGNKFNLTFMLINPDLTGLPTWQKCEGWASEEADGNSQVMVNDEVKASDGRNAFYEYWSDPAKASNLFSLYQQVDLAKGIYNMSCLAFAKDQNTGKNVRGVKFYANDTEGSTIQKDYLEEASIEFVNTADGTVKIGLKTVEGNTCNWMGIGYVELYKLYNVKEAQLADNDAAAPAAGAYTVVTSDRKLLKGLNTIVLPFATTMQELGVKQVLRYDGTETVDGKLRLNFTAVEELSANTPYAVFVEADQSLPSFENKTITEPTNLTVADAESQYDFVGTYKAYDKSNSPIVNGDYISGDIDFKKAAGGNVIKAYRAYMKKTGDSASEPTFFVNGVQVDGIQAVEMGNALNDGVIYNLNGQKVDKAQRGVYIINGKKVVVK